MTAEPRRRPNGQPQACEPCRKAKVRCDHAAPTCTRCHTRRLQCSYHPAPMTKRARMSNSQASVESSAIAELVTIVVTPAHFQHGSEPTIQTENHSVPLVDPNPRLSVTEAAPATPSGGKCNTIFQKEAGQHETTRYSAIFFENEESFGPHITEAVTSKHKQYSQIDVASGPRMELAINTLLQFPTARTCDILVTGLADIHDVWVSPFMVQECLNQVWTEYGDCLSNSRTRESVTRMARDIFLNHEGRPPVFNDESGDGVNPASWKNWFGGPRLRWEMLGILFCWAGMAFRHRQEWDPVFNLPEQQGRNRHTAAERMREGAAACVKLCEAYFEMSDSMVVCLKNCTKLTSIIISDESDRIRVDYGTVRSAFMAAGLHRQPAEKEVTPLSQHRALIAASMYYLDKCESLYNSRPPVLNRHYCQCPVPLDLCEEDVYGGRDRLAAACAKLDSNGWGKDGKISTATWLRALAFLCQIREGILELSLGVNSQFTKSQVDDLIVQLRQIAISYPPHIRFSQGSDSLQPPAPDLKRRTASDMYIVTRIHLEVLQCHFLLQRFLVSKGLSGGQKLFDIAQETISIIVTLWSNRDRLQSFHHAFDWISVSSGIPCAGVLCIEILRACNLAPRVSSTSNPSNSSGDTYFAPVQLSRSEVIQNLCKFIALLDWIRPTDNNAQLLGKLKGVLQRIIDKVFESLGPVTIPPVPQLITDSPSQDESDPRGESIGMSSQDELDFAITTIDDMDWLSTFDWTQGGWLEQCS